MRRMSGRWRCSRLGTGGLSAERAAATPDDRRRSRASSTSCIARVSTPYKIAFGRLPVGIDRQYARSATAAPHSLDIVGCYTGLSQQRTANGDEVAPPILGRTMLRPAGSWYRHGVVSYCLGQDLPVGSDDNALGLVGADIDAQEEPGHE